MEIDIEAVSYLVQKPKTIWKNPSHLFAPEERVLLLNNINLRLQGGTISCLIGTGEGQLKLLELIALRQTEGFMSGNILHDRIVRPSGAYSDIAYITNDATTYYDGLYVFDYLYYGARLRLSCNSVQCRERVRDIIKLIGLDGGLKISRLKKGEIVLLSIALEYLSFPTLLVLNNPIINLEYGEAIAVIRSLKRLTKRKLQPITIVFIADGINEDMLQLVDCISIFTGMRLSFNISLNHEIHTIAKSVDAHTSPDILQQLEAVNTLYSLITEASMELLRKPKHLQNTLVEDNLLKICNDLNGLKGIVERDVPLAKSQTVGIEISDILKDDLEGEEENYKRTDSFIATRMRGKHVLQEHNEIIRSKMRSTLFKPYYKEIEILVIRELMFMTSNVSTVNVEMVFSLFNTNILLLFVAVSD